MPQAPPAGACCFAADAAWTLWASGSQRSLVFNAGQTAAPLARLDWTVGWPRTALLHYAPTVTLAELLFEYPLLQHQVIEHLADHAGLLVHAGAVVLDDAAVLFSGPPGVGKSTLARLCRSAGLPVLSDDRVALRAQPAGFVACGTPWHSSAVAFAPLQSPLRAICMLRHGPVNQLIRLTPSEALRRLAPEVLLPLWDQAAVTAVLAGLAALIATLPCYDLAFVPDSAVLSVLRDAARG